MKSLISVDDLKRLEADDHHIVSIDVDTFLTHIDPLNLIFFILEQKQIGVKNVKLNKILTLHSLTLVGKYISS